jgi:hypothetical protein
MKMNIFTLHKNKILLDLKDQMTKEALVLKEKRQGIITIIAWVKICHIMKKLSGNLNYKRDQRWVIVEK